jgi:hypothetical protein
LKGITVSVSLSQAVRASIFRPFVYILHKRTKVLLAEHRAFQAGAAAAFQQEPGGSIVQAHCLHDVGYGSYLVDGNVIESIGWQGFEEGYKQKLVGFEGLVCGGYTEFGSRQNGQKGIGKNHRIPDVQQRQFIDRPGGTPPKDPRSGSASRRDVTLGSQ